MKVITLVNQKGGCGRSTIAVNLAVAAAERGEKVLLLDLDSRVRSVRDWAKVRKLENISVYYRDERIGPRDIDSIIEQARDDNGFSLTVIDTEGGDQSDNVGKSCTLSRALDVADLCLVPMTAGPIEWNAIARTMGMLRSREGKYAFVLNRVIRAKTASEMRDDLMLDGFIVPVEIGDCRDISEAAGQGLGIIEQDPECAASDQFNNLWDWCRTRLLKLHKRIIVHTAPLAAR